MAKVLIVDDEPEVTEFIKRSLERRGFEVVVATTGQQALDLYPQENPQVVLLDLGLPDINGRDVLKEIKSKSLQIKVMIVSGYTDQNTKQELISMGADSFLDKPIIPTKIADAIKEILEKPKT
jgi:two-component system KDP operon response regulator KdpE